MKYTITGTLKCVSPLHITKPGSAYYDPTTRTVGQKKTGEAKPVSLQQTMQLLLPEPRVSDERIDLTQSVPVIPANLLAGAIRRAAVSAVMDDKIRPSGERVAFTTYSGMVSGTHTTSPSSLPIDLNFLRDATSNLFLGIFGGGVRMVEANRRTATAYPVCELAATLGLIPASGEKEMLPLGKEYLLTEKIHFRRADDLMDFSRHVEAGASIAEYEGKILERAQTLAEGQTRRAEQRKAEQAGESFERTAKSNLDGLTYLEYVIPGTEFHFSTSIDTATVGLAGLGLYLRAIQNFVANGQVGGWGRNGFGQFTATLHLVDPDTGSREEICAGSKFSAFGPIAKEAHQAWTDAQLTAADLDRVYVLE
jgi:CRISPR type IV-associated protein Csf2